MHRSGTSALSRVLNLGGADLGTRLLGASAGNEKGHWEDAFAVEEHERLLASFGTRWDEPFTLPMERSSSDAYRESGRRILGYLRNERAHVPLWAIKDPRLCLFVDLWMTNAHDADLSVSGVLMLRHPREIADSLAARDGIGEGHAMLLWLDYMVSAAIQVAGIANVVVSYDALLEDWRKVVARIGTVPGGDALAFPAAQAREVDDFLDSGMRHHHSADDRPLPLIVQEVWDRLRATELQGHVDLASAQWLGSRVAPIRELLKPYAEEKRSVQLQLWNRLGAGTAHTVADAGVDDYVSRFEARADRHHDDLVRMISGDIRVMQGEHAAMARAVERAQAELQIQSERGDRAEAFARWAAQVWGDASEQRHAMDALSDAVLAMEQRLANAISVDIQQMQSAYDGMLETASRVQGELAVTRSELEAERVSREAAERRVAEASEAMDALSQTVIQMGARVTDAISEDIRTMQAAHDDLLAEAARLQGELSAARSNADAERAGREAAERRAAVTQEAMDSLTASVVSMEERLANSISEDIQRMQLQHAEVLAVAGRLQGELGIAQAAVEHVRSQRDQLQAELENARLLQDRLGHQLHESSAERDALSTQLQQTQALLDHQRATVAELETSRSRDRAEIARLTEDSRMLGAVVQSSSWRLTRPLRFTRRVLSRGFGRQERASFAAWVSRSRWVPLPSVARAALARRLAPHALPLPELLPGSGPEGLPAGGIQLPPLAAPLAHADVFVWAVIDWHFRTQRPQHLARALATKGHRVFYMSNNLVDSVEAGFTIEDLDGSGRLFQVHLKVPGAPSIYAHQPSEADAAALRASLASFLAWSSTTASMSIVQHPYWTDLAQVPPNARLVYDCMDHHAGFGDNNPEVLEAEHRLCRQSDMVITTSRWLHQEISGYREEVALIRNATDYEHFRLPPAEVYHDPQGRRVVGYIGAIAEWFDVDAVRAIATHNPECSVVLVGADTAGVQGALADLPNVVFAGEVPYASLPYWLHAFDVCLLPFRVIPLTLATNPVKVYEYLSAGKPVVATNLPEMEQFEGLIDTANSPEDFGRKVAESLSAPVLEEAVKARQAFASRQTWAHRAEQLDSALESIREPRVSVVVLSYNNLAFTDACLFSIEAYSDYADLEVIVVDNASSDGTREYLQDWVTKGSNRKIILNDENRGFAAGNNQGLAAASGDYLVLLNNDTYVTPGWVRTMLRHFSRAPDLGLVGPVTNNIGNEARIEIGYGSMSEMIQQAGLYTRAHPGRIFPISVVAFFCVMMPRKVYESVGGLDEAFGIGFFEDDDYCRRTREAGFEIGCAEDVFVHHHLSASFDQLKEERRRELFERNRAIYEQKWGPWIPHNYRGT